MNEQGTSLTTSLERLRAEVLGGRLDRRTVLKRGATLGLSAPVIAGLLAACGGSDKATATIKPVATSGTGAGSPTTSSAAPTATSGGTSPSPTARSASPTTSAPASPTTATTGSNPADAPGHGRGKADLLRILYWQAPTILNPHFAQGTKDSAAASLVLEPLFEVDAAGNLQAILAAEVPSLENGGVAKDGMSVTAKLKQGVKWSDGAAFGANDVRFTWQYVTNKDTSATTFAAYATAKDIQVIDDHTVKFVFDKPTPGWIVLFSTGFGGQVLPEHILKDNVGTTARDAPFNLKPIGTGPYKVKDFKPGDAIQFEMNENYREADKPYFKEIEFKGGGDATGAARAALESGETDWAWNLQVEASVLNDLAKGAAGDLLVTPGTSGEQILINFADPNTEVDGAKAEPTTKHPFFSDKAVRQAFALGCDRDTIASQIYGQAGEATANTLMGPTKFVSPNTTYKFDTAAGEALLDQAGWTKDGGSRKKGGKEMSVLYQTTVNPVRQKTQEVVKAAWESMGIKVELKSIDAGVFFSSDAGNPDTAAHFYADVEMFTNGAITPYPVGDYLASFKSNNPPQDLSQKSNQWAGANYNRWVNEDYNKFWEQASVELDVAKQPALFFGMNDLAVNEVVIIPLVFRKAVQAASKKLKGYDSFNFSPWSPDTRNIADWYFAE